MLRAYERELLWAARPAAALLAMVGTLTLASATWKPEYAAAPQEIQDWYRAAELTPAAQKRFPWKSCCAHADVVRTRFRVNRVDGEDEWDWLDGATWKRIPPDIIHIDKHAPDGQPTLFVIQGNPVCFFTPEGGI